MARAKPRGGRTLTHDQLVQGIVGDGGWALFLDDPLEGEDLPDSERRAIIAEAEDILAERKLRQRAAVLEGRLREWPRATRPQVEWELAAVKEALEGLTNGKRKANRRSEPGG